MTASTSEAQRLRAIGGIEAPPPSYKYTGTAPEVTCCRSQKENGTMGTKTCIGKVTALRVVLHEACVCKRDAPTCVRIRLWPLRRDDSSRVMIGAAGVWRSDWRRRDVGALFGQTTCRLMAFARKAIDSTRAGATT